MNIKIFEPWCDENIETVYNQSINGKIPVLSLDLGSKCTFCSCLYCDTPVNQNDTNKLSFNNIKSLIKDLHSLGLHWIFICGLGEPSQDENFFSILKYASNLNIKVVFFTNGLGYEDNKYFDTLLNTLAYPIVKLDALDYNVFDKIIRKDKSSIKIHSFINRLISCDFIKSANTNSTNLAVSIVPTRINFECISDVIDFCKQNNIFPCIGDLELSNQSILNKDKLWLEEKEMYNLHKMIKVKIGYYHRNLCPGIFISLRVANNGDVLVGKNTGFSCSWFLQTESSYEILGNIKHDAIDYIISKIDNYRMKNLKNAELLALKVNPIFSAGGGSFPKEWFHKYLHYVNFRNSG